MLKKFLQRFVRQPAEPAPAEEQSLSPLTVLAIEPEKPDEPALDLIDVDHLFTPWLLGMGEAAPLELNEAEHRILRALKREADDNHAATADLVPRIPSVIPVLLRSLRDRNISNQQLAAQVTQDAVLVAAVLRQVNSSYYRRASEVKTIEEAIAIIGQNGLRILVASVAFKPLFNAGLGRATALGAPRIWELAEPYGIACRWLGQRRGVDEFMVFLAGLLQNVGIIVALRLLDQAGGAAPGELRSLSFHNSFIHYARRLAQLVGRHWQFPAQAVNAVGRMPAAGDEAIVGVLGQADRVAKVHVLVRQGALREDHAEACLEGSDTLACYRRLQESAPPG